MKAMTNFLNKLGLRAKVLSGPAVASDSNGFLCAVDSAQ